MTRAYTARRRLVDRMSCRHAVELARARHDAAPVDATPPEFPTRALHGYHSGLMDLGRRIRRTLLDELVPHVEQLAARARADGYSDPAQLRIGVAGGPRTGKTTLAAALAARHGLPVLHTDDLMHLGWSEASAHTADAMLAARAGIFEGVAVPRAVRKALEASPARPLELLLVLRQTVRELTPGQAAMQRGHDSVLDPLLRELERRGVRILEADAEAAYANLEAAIGPSSPRTDAADPTVERLVARARAALRFDVTPYAQRAGLRVAEQTRRNLDEQLARALGRPLERAGRMDAKANPVVGTVNPFDPASGIAKQLDAFVRAQTKRAGSMTDETYAQVQKSVRAGLELGLRPNELAAKIIADTGKVSTQQAIVIANDAVGQLHAKFTEIRQTSLGITHYRWRTAGDLKVRPGHRALEGSIQAWDSPPVVNPKTGKKAHPGFDTNYFACRCNAIPIVDPATIQPPADSPLATTPAIPGSATGQLSLPGLKHPPKQPVRAEWPTGATTPPKPQPAITPPPAPAPPKPPPAPQPTPKPPVAPPAPPKPPPPAITPTPPSSAPPYTITSTSAPPSSGPAVTLTVRVPAPGKPSERKVPAAPKLNVRSTVNLAYDHAVRMLRTTAPQLVEGPIGGSNVVDSAAVIQRAGGSKVATDARRWADQWVGHSSDRLAKQIVDGLGDSDSFAHAQYQATQALFRANMSELMSRGVIDADGYITAYRGVHGKQADDIGKLLSKSKTGIGKLPLRAVSSWSASHKVARTGFGGTDGLVLEQRVHYTRILAAHYFERDWGIREFEFALLAPEGSMRVTIADETVFDPYRRR